MARQMPWFWGNLGDGLTPEQVTAYLNQRMKDLDQYLRFIHNDLAFGPIPGAYVGVFLGADREPGTALANGTLDRFTFPFEADVAMVQLYCVGGDATVDIESNGSSILSAGSKALLDGTSVFMNLSTDFASQPMHVKDDLTLIKDSTDASTPHRIHLRAILKNVSKVETT